MHKFSGGMWTIKKQIITPNQVLQYQILQDGNLMSFEEVIYHWGNTPIFRSFYNTILVNAPFEAFFWELPPMTAHKLKQDFEFVLVNSGTLKNIRADERAFQEYFKKHSRNEILTFPNLSGDAQLIVPTPQIALENYAHLAKVVRNVPDSQLDELWMRIGEEYEKALKKSPKPKWLSTAGLGVSWLHIRIDSRPKYYRYKPYKEWSKD
ncbi:MAG: hypothetical protein R3E32_13050 [Chitinophagales bacterium]